MQLKKILTVLVALVPLGTLAQRLPGNVVPDHYSLSFTPNLRSATFAGQETIDVRIIHPGNSITLNSTEIEFQKVNITQGGNIQEAKVTLDSEKEQATLTVPNPLAAGPATIEIQFTGILNDKLHGFYLAKTRLRSYGATQFESTDARRAFPSFDEPALKATFDLILIVDKDDTAISNGHIISDTPGPGPEKHTLKFSPTKKMSTYLVAMAVGDFQCNEGSADGIPIRVCGTPDKKPLGVVAVHYAEEILKFYNQYYGIKYPFEKLDIVGVPDFEAGAMENTGAIFYRESLLFLDEQRSSMNTRQAVFEVLAHEMAHQWFGDLVTMKWWDNLWLNEGFATWMALKPSQALHPEWKANLGAVSATNGALQVDALKTTHPIRVKAETPQEISELFDAISYEKAAAVLRMIESYVSPDVFRRGVNSYLHKFSYSNATAEDFWDAIAQASGRPVDKIMMTFINQPGEPLVSVSTKCVTPPPQTVSTRTRKGRKSRTTVTPHPKTEVTLTQERFFSDPNSAPQESDRWMIPVCFKSSDGKPFCQILSQREETVPLTGCSAWVFTNANAVGYYRTQYNGEAFQKLNASAMAQLGTAERMSLVDDEAALVRVGKENVAKLLDLVAALNQDFEQEIVGSYIRSLLNTNNYLVASHDRPAFQSWIRSNFRQMMEKIGWTPSATESSDVGELRLDLLGILAGIGEDPEALRQSASLAEQYLKNPDSVNPELARIALTETAHRGDAALFDHYLAAMRQARSPEQFYTMVSAMSGFRDPQLVQRWLQISVSDATRNQDAAVQIATVLRRYEVSQIAWQWIKDHWPEVEKKTTMSSGASIVAATAGFCDAQSRDDVQQFFQEHKVPSTERVLRQVAENVNACISFREHQQKNLTSWLGQHGGSIAAGTGDH
jgi:aminopeptidase N/puromycin-sensitive aminopeptidase